MKQLSIINEMKRELISDFRRTFLVHIICILALALLSFFFKFRGHTSFIRVLGVSTALVGLMHLCYFAEDWAQAFVENQLSISRTVKEHREEMPYYLIVTSLDLSLYMLILPIKFYCFLVLPLVLFIVIMLVLLFFEWWHKI